MTKKPKHSTKEIMGKITNIGHIWVNAFNCINPTKEFKVKLADTILEALEKHKYIRVTINKS